MELIDNTDRTRLRGRNLLLTITAVAAVLQIVKAVFHHAWPTLGQWSQLLMVVSMFAWLWDGYNWARIGTSLYYLAVSMAGGLTLFRMWSKAVPSGVVMVLLFIAVTAWIATAISFSPSIRHYLVCRRTQLRGATSPVL
jgi:hypothetical protein